MHRMMPVVRAFDRTLIKEIPEDDEKALSAKLEKANAVFQDRKKWLKPFQRMTILKAVAEKLSQKESFFAKQIAEEGGKPITDAIAEVKRAIDGIYEASEALRTFGGREIPMELTAASVGRVAWTKREPFGVIAAISAFNHPLNLIVHQVIPAIAIGAPVIIKPAATTPLSCIELVKLIHEAGLPENFLQTFITSDNALAEKLALDPRISFLSFIGSSKVGWSLKSKLLPGVHCTLEHGGAAPVIVTNTADLSKAIPALLKGGYYHAGQVCVSVQRIFVEESILSNFMKQWVEKVDLLRVGDPLLKETEVGPLIHPREVERVIDWIKEATDMGATCYGGERLSETTLKPAILLNPPENAKASQCEIFGPVTCVYSYQTLDEAISRANALPYAFQAAIFSAEINEAFQAAEQLSATAVMVNDNTAFRVDWMPFGGFKQSGYGMGGISETMLAMTHEKLIVFKINPA